MKRFAAIVEILAAFVLVHVAFRALKNFTALGRAERAAHLNFTPGLVMIFFTVVALLLCRRSFAAYGLTLTRWEENVKIGLFWAVFLVAGAGILTLLGVRHQPGFRTPTMFEGTIYGIGSVGVVVLFAWMLKRRHKVLVRFPTAVCVSILGGLLLLPVVLALYFGRPVAHVLFTVSWLVVGAACGEEVFYRGYIQSRLNEAFGRPLRFLGMQFGVGLLISSLLFGILHTLNSVDYFHGRYTFAWGFGVAAFGVGLLYGSLRETTGSVLAGIVTHALVDVLVIVPGLMT